MTTYKKRDIDERLKSLGAMELEKEGRDYGFSYRGFSVRGIVVTHPGKEVPDFSVNKIARKITELDGYTPGTKDYEFHLKKIKNVLRGIQKSPNNLEERAISIFAIFLGIFLGLILIRSFSLTGLVVLEKVSVFVVDSFIVICFFLIVVFLVLKNLARKRQKKE